MAGFRIRFTLTGTASLVLPALLIVAAAAASPSSDTREGRDLFAEECGICHREPGPGTIMLRRRLGPDKALLEERSDLEPQYIEGVVRQGLRSMPPLTRVDVPDGALAKIIAYLTAAPGNAGEGGE